MKRLLLILFLTINSLFAANRFYVRNGSGCGGTFNTTSCWSATSGGASGASVPTAADDAIFDANSFTAGGTITLDANMSFNTLDFFNINQNITVANGGNNTITIDNVVSGYSLRWASTASRISTLNANLTFNDDAVNFVFSTPGTGTVTVYGRLQTGASSAATGNFSVTGLSDKQFFWNDWTTSEIHSAIAVFQGVTTFGGNATNTCCTLTNFHENVDFLNDAVISGYISQFCTDDVSGTNARFFGKTTLNEWVRFHEPVKFYGATTVTGRFEHWSSPTNKKMYVAPGASLLFNGPRNGILWECGINANGPVTIARSNTGNAYVGFLARYSGTYPDTFNFVGNAIDFGDYISDNDNNQGVAIYANPVYMTTGSTMILGAFTYLRFDGTYDADGPNTGACTGCYTYPWTCPGTGYNRSTFGNFHMRPFAYVHFNDGNAVWTFNTFSITGNNMVELGSQSTCQMGEASYQIKNLVSSATACAGYNTIRNKVPGIGNYSSTGPRGGNNALVSISGSTTLTGTILQDIVNASNNSLVGITATIDLGGNRPAWITKNGNDWNGSSFPLRNSGNFSFTGVSTSETFYWIGKSNANNNWSNPSNWSLSSGGPPNAGGCIPSTRTNVIFDGNSYSANTQRTVLDGAYQYCKQMTWNLPASASGVMMFGTISGSKLQIWDDLKFSQYMINSFLGTVEFNSETTTSGYTLNTINSTTLDTYNYKGPVYFKNATTQWQLTSDLKAASSFNIVASKVDVSNNGTSSGTFANITVLGNWYLEGAQFSARTGTVHFKGTSTQSVQVWGNDTYMQDAFYNVIFENPSNFNLDSYDSKVFIAPGGSAKFVNGIVRTKTDNDSYHGLIFMKGSKALNYLGQDLATSNYYLLTSPGGPNNAWVTGEVVKWGTEDFVFPVGSDASWYFGHTATQYRPIALTSLTGVSGFNSTNIYNSSYYMGSGGWATTNFVSPLSIVGVNEYWKLGRVDMGWNPIRGRCAQRASNQVTIIVSQRNVINGVVTTDGLYLNPFSVGDMVYINNFSDILSGAANGNYSVVGVNGNFLTVSYPGGNIGMSCNTGSNTEITLVYASTQNVSIKLPWRDGTTDATPNFINNTNDYLNLKLGMRLDGGANDGNFADATRSIIGPSNSNASGILLSKSFSTSTLTGGLKSRFFNFGGAITVTPLPVLNIINFDAIVYNKSVELTWSLKHTKNDVAYIIQRSSDASNFTDLISENSSKSKTVFSRTDDVPLKGISYYRLKIVKDNGNHEYSEIKTVNFDSESNISLYPNPIAKGTFLSIYKTNDTPTEGFKFTLMDLTGKNILSGWVQNENSILIPQYLSDGVYFLKIDDSISSLTERLIVR
ncbi:MAG: T9SS type A sorting domain-containing protein [Bacteroidota bacterium]|nr:T9SS type A sorting domain-containing protein [Bacteroidota bacterium]